MIKWLGKKIKEKGMSSSMTCPQVEKVMIEM